MNAIPERYNDSLAARTFPHRFRKVGNPYAFLNDVGIVPILEYLYKGNLLIDVAEAVNVSYTVLQKWVEQEGHDQAIQDAQKISAEGYLAEGLRRLREAKNEFELKRAKEMVNHARFMASKKDKATYGSTEQIGAERGGVSYVFNIGGNVVTQQATAPVEAKPVIEGELAEPPVVVMDMLSHLDQNFEDLFGVPTPKQAKPMEPIKRSPPSKPVGSGTADAPEVGPFYD